MESNSIEQGHVPTQFDQLHFSDISAIEKESRESKIRKKPKVMKDAERREMVNSFRYITKGRVLQDMKQIAERFGVSVPTVKREYHSYQQSVGQHPFCQAAVRPSVPQAWSSEMVAGQPPVFSHASQLSSSLLANARGGRNHHVFEVRGRSWYRLLRQQSA